MSKLVGLLSLLTKKQQILALNIVGKVRSGIKTLPTVK